MQPEIFFLVCFDCQCIPNTGIHRGVPQLIFVKEIQTMLRELPGIALLNSFIPEEVAVINIPV